MALVTVPVKAMCPKSLEAQGLLQTGDGPFQLLGMSAVGRGKETALYSTGAKNSSSNKL